MKTNSNIHVRMNGTVGTFLLTTYINWTIYDMLRLLIDINLVETLTVLTSIGYLLLAVRKAKKHLASCIP